MPKMRYVNKDREVPIRCPNCFSDEIVTRETSTQIGDYICEICGARF